MANYELTRKELYDLVWTVPITSLAKQFKITPAIIKSACREKKIPLPGPGFWVKMEHEKVVQITELPIDDSYWINVPTYITPTEELCRNRVKRIKDEIDKTCKKYLKLPLNLSKPDKLVLEAKNTLNKKRPNRYGREEGFISTDPTQISVFVTKKNVNRSLRLVDAFIKLIRARDHEFEKENNKIQIVVGGEKYDFSLREKQKRNINPDKTNEFKYEASGLLVISVGQYSRKREFLDSNQPLEKQLSKIVAYLEYVTDDWKKEMAYHEAKRKVREEEERQLEEIRKKEELEKERFKDLLEQANRWHQVKILREYISAVEKCSNPLEVKSQKIQEWVKWAEEKANCYDPLVNIIQIKQ